MNTNTFSRASVRLSLAAAAAIAILSAGVDAAADNRIFGYSYPYMTLPQGGFEIEHILDAGLFRADDPSTGRVEDVLRPAWEHQIELEYGISDHMDFGFYNVFTQGPYEGLKYEGVKLRSRYRFAEQGDLFVDPAVYLEVSYFGDEVELEQRLILAKTWKKLELALNLKAEEEFGLKYKETEVEYVFTPSLGVGWRFTERFAAGVEYAGRIARAEEEWEPYTDFVGPSISVAGSHFWWSLAIQKQLSATAGRPTWRARSMFAVLF